MRLLLFVFLLLVAARGHSQVGPSAKDEDVLRFLQATHYIEPFKAGIRAEKEKAAKTNALMEFILMSDPQMLERVIARVFSRHLTNAQAKEAADFYSSATGRFITEAQLAQPDTLRTPLVLTREQASDYRRFASKGTEAAVAKLLQDRSIGAELMTEIESVRPK